jgi:hypothetical protein
VDFALVLALVLPIVAIQVVLIVLALRDLVRPERRVVGGNKVVWGIVIVALELLGPVLYFLAGRETE